MERNRVLWVIFSISLFLVVVLAAGLYFLRPKPAETPREAAGPATSPAESFDVFEYVRGRSELPRLEERREPEATVIVVGEPEPEGPQKAQPKTALPEAEPKGAPPQAPPPSAPAAPAARGPASRAAAPPAAGPVPRVAVAPVQRPERRAPRSVPRPGPRPAPQRVPQRVAEYWIQVGSFGSLGRAQELGRSLDEHGLAPTLTTRVVSGQTYYRVRVGPYPSKAEAQKFLEWIRGLEGFQSSYVSMVTVRRVDP
jgi:cell division protein FtsN